ncbi:hypothetical protein FDF74_11540 [Clostridium niameyense]|uniref:Uncharacterized protein n=1 Tax=Clostridium niameyense TaxID=1622073 RepID=A0A6M0RC50_9CLOT|nr:hypothetical protein [Clostridium niameyense]NEZ47814.1 hypothetical protein [Clostridium niameyense]
MLEEEFFKSFWERGKYHLPENTTTEPLIDAGKLNLIDKIEEINKNLKSIKDILYYLIHPKQLIMLFWGGIVQYSYVICLIVGLISILFYVSGRKKSGKWITGSVLAYTIIQALNLAFK